MKRGQDLEGPLPLFLGVEGGATRTVAIVADDAGRLIERIEAGPANLALLTDAALTSLLRSLARRTSRPSALCLGLAGLRNEKDHARVRDAAAQVWPGTPCHTCGDLDTALAAAAPDQPGEVNARVLILSGTGSCCFGRNLRGEVARVGGWGHMLGDKGSGYEIGLRALKSVVYAFDRDGAWPDLGARLLGHVQLNVPEDLIPWVQGASKTDLASLAPLVFAAWQRRDKIAGAILTAAADYLAEDGAACGRRLARVGEPIRFILSGSCLLKQPAFAKAVTARLAKLWPGASVSRLERESAWGAVALAQALWLRSKAAVTRVGLSDGVMERPEERSPNERIQIPEATALSPTEKRNPRSTRLDTMPLTQAVSLMLSEEGKVAPALLRHRATITRCVREIVRVFRRGGRLFYAGAGTSGRLGVLDASECPPTFSVSSEQVQGIIAGGHPALWLSLEGAEDDVAAGAAAVRFRDVRRGDILVGIAASGRTPFVWGALHAAKARGTRTVLLCFNPHLRIHRVARPHLVLAVDLGPEVLTGSTRLKAGTATKLLLNLFTTLSMVQLGKVESNLMVDVNPSNSKLRERAIRIVRELSRADEPKVRAALEASGWNLKKALNRLRH